VSVGSDVVRWSRCVVNVMEKNICFRMMCL